VLAYLRLQANVQYIRLKANVFSFPNIKEYLLLLVVQIESGGSVCFYKPRQWLVAAPLKTLPMVFVWRIKNHRQGKKATAEVTKTRFLFHRLSKFL
jgi:hypothetical protein